MLTIEIVNKKIRKSLSKLSVNKTGLKKHVINPSNQYDARSVYIKLKLDDDIELFCDTLTPLFEKILIDDIDTTYIPTSLGKTLNKKELYELSKWDHFLVNNQYYILYRISPMMRIPTEINISKEAISETLENNKLNVESLDIDMSKNSELEKIDIEFAVLYKKGDK